jgi:beta-xylosidase
LSAELELAAGTTAGLLLFYNEKFFCGIASDGRVLHAYNLGAENAFELRSPAPRGRVHFRLVNEEQVGRFYFSTDGLEWTLYRSFEVAGYNHNIAGGYLSLRPAIFACGEGGAFLHNLQYSAK